MKWAKTKWASSHWPCFCIRSSQGGVKRVSKGHRVGGANRGDRVRRREPSSHWCWVTYQRDLSCIPWVRGKMEELEHTCPHPRTVGHLWLALFLSVGLCVCVCGRGGRLLCDKDWGGDWASCVIPVMKQILCSLLLLAFTDCWVDNVFVWCF